MAQLNSNGIATHTEDMSELPFGNYTVRGTYPENQYYKSSTGTAVIHHYPTSSDERTCHEAEHFCEYTPSTYTRGEAGENITEDQLCAVANNQFIVADMKNSTSMEVLIGILEGQQTELENTRIYLLHGPDLQVYCEKDATDGYLHIHYTHPTNPAYANINIATTLDFTDANKFTFTIDDGGCCTLRVWNQNSNGDGTWSTTLDYTYTFPSEYILEPLDVWRTSTGVSTTSRVLVEGIDYEYTYKTHKVINCRDGTNWNTIGNNKNQLPLNQAIYDNYGFVSNISPATRNELIYSFLNMPLSTFKRLEVELQMRSSNAIGCLYGLLDISQAHTRSTLQMMGVIPFYSSYLIIMENHDYPEVSRVNNRLNNSISDTLVRVTFTVTGDRHIVYKDNFGNRFVSANEYTIEEIQKLRFSWAGSGMNNEYFSVTKCRIYEDYSAIDPQHVP